jgi:hypothetical protein
MELPVPYETINNPKKKLRHFRGKKYNNNLRTFFIS